MQIVFDDKDLEELITTGRNSKYKKYTRNQKFMKALATAYNYLRLSERASDLRSILSSTMNNLQEPMARVPSELSTEWLSAYFSASLTAALE